MTPGYKTYLYEYHHEGATWAFEIPATSEDDAHARVQKLPLARLLGTLEMKIPAVVPGAGWFASFWCWWKNLWGGK